MAADLAVALATPLLVSLAADFALAFASCLAAELAAAEGDSLKRSIRLKNLAFCDSPLTVIRSPISTNFSFPDSSYLAANLSAFNWKRASCSNPWVNALICNLLKSPSMTVCKSSASIFTSNFPPAALLRERFSAKTCSGESSPTNEVVRSISVSMTARAPAVSAASVSSATACKAPASVSSATVCKAPASVSSATACKAPASVSSATVCKAPASVSSADTCKAAASVSSAIFCNSIAVVANVSSSGAASAAA